MRHEIDTLRGAARINIEEASRYLKRANCQGAREVRIARDAAAEAVDKLDRALALAEAERHQEDQR